MNAYHTCPQCNNEAARDPYDARLGAVCSGAFLVDKITGKLSGGSGASYRYHCASCDTDFVVHHSTIFSNGDAFETDYIEIVKGK